MIVFTHDSKDCTEAIKLAFTKNQADDRKTWLSNFNSSVVVNHNIKVLSYEDFIHKELIHFSIADN